MDSKNIQIPVDKILLQELRSGDLIYLTGIMYTMRDVAHQRIIELLKNRTPLPFDLKGSAIYYAGPSPTKPGEIIGSLGPTTSYRMDLYTDCLLKEGVAITIGKGNRSLEVRKSCQKNGSLYCAAYGGAGAYLSSKIEAIKCVAFEDLGPEAIYQLSVKDFPVTVINDTLGQDLYEMVANKNIGEEDEQD